MTTLKKNHYKRRKIVNGTKINSQQKRRRVVRMEALFNGLCFYQDKAKNDGFKSNQHQTIANLSLIQGKSVNNNAQKKNLQNKRRKSL